MAASIKDVSDFFKTGDPKRDSLGEFKNEWMVLTEEEKDFFRAEVEKSTGA